MQRCDDEEEEEDAKSGAKRTDDRQATDLSSEMGRMDGVTNKDGRGQNGTERRTAKTGDENENYNLHD